MTTINWNEEKYDEFEASLKERFPVMFSEPYGGIAVGPGWWPVIDALCRNIQHYLNWINKNHEKHPVVEQVIVRQIKEKFGGLRFYYDGGDDKIHGMVRMAEAWADASCEECGKPGIRRDGGWIRTLCDEHEAEYQAKRKKYNEDE